MKQLDASELKKVILQILIEFDQFCSRHDLLLYPAGGTMLGAIRHKGFIPWDDDIDVCMPREDYEKMMQIFPRDPIARKYGLIGYELGNAEFPFVKVIDKRTKVEQRYSNSDENSCLWIDVLPVDGVPDDVVKSRDIYRKVEKYRKILMLNFANPKEGKTRMKRIFKRFVIPFAKMYGTKRANEKIIALAKSTPFQSAHHVGIISWGLYGTGEIVDKKAFVQPVPVEFEGYQMSAMSCWDEYLSGIYGDYMTLPPAEQRQTHEMRAWINE
jgi:lipopolysaccharide cholinephosphotransferase